MYDSRNRDPDARNDSYGVSENALLQVGVSTVCTRRTTPIQTTTRCP